MLKCVMFDWGGTLSDEHGLFRKIAGEFTYPFWKKMGFSGTLEEYMEAEKEAVDGLWALWKERKVQKKEDWAMLFSKNAGIKITEQDALQEFGLFWEGYAKHSKLFPDAESILRHVKSKNMLLALVSNNWTESYRIFEKYGISDKFDVKVLSEEVSALKSELTPFRRALESLNVAPDECLMVGDRIDEDGACRKLGIKFCLIDTKNEHASDSSVFDYRITKLSELENIINVMCEKQE